MTFSLILNWAFKHFSFSQTNSHPIFTNYETLVHLTAFRPWFFILSPAPSLPTFFLFCPSRPTTPIFFNSPTNQPGLISPYSRPEFWFPSFPISNYHFNIFFIFIIIFSTLPCGWRWLPAVRWSLNNSVFFLLLLFCLFVCFFLFIYYT